MMSELEIKQEVDQDEGHKFGAADVSHAAVNKHNISTGGENILEGEENKPDGTIVTHSQPADANAKDDCSDLTDNNNDPEEQAPKSFPQKLMDILQNDGHSEVISWLPHGNGFIIHKKKTFASDILPKFFKASKFTSFTRKLNRWGFTRVPRGPETGAYFHKLFRRDKPELCLQMTSNSGNKYQPNPLQQQLLPNVPGMMPPQGAMPTMPGMFPYMPNPMMANMSPQQQQAMWQQQMQHMMQLQQMQMMQMQQGGRPPNGPPVGPNGVPMPGMMPGPGMIVTGMPIGVVPANAEMGQAGAGQVSAANNGNQTQVPQQQQQQQQQQPHPQLQQPMPGMQQFNPAVMGPNGDGNNAEGGAAGVPNKPPNAEGQGASAPAMGMNPTGAATPGAAAGPTNVMGGMSPMGAGGPNVGAAPAVSQPQQSPANNQENSLGVQSVMTQNVTTAENVGVAGVEI